MRVSVLAQYWALSLNGLLPGLSKTSDDLSENVSIALLRMSPTAPASKAANAAWTDTS